MLLRDTVRRGKSGFFRMLTSLFAKTRRITQDLFLALLLMFSWVACSPAMSQSLLPPKDTPILTINGKIQNSNVQGAAVFDKAMLEALGEESFVTSSPWYTNPQKFSGVSLEKLLQHVGATGQIIKAKALNNYSVTIPRSDFSKYHVIAAMKLNDQPMSVREKGPLFVIYPFDTDPDLASAGFYARSIWQLASLEVM